jgi:hypothetical protein
MQLPPDPEQNAEAQAMHRCRARYQAAGPFEPVRCVLWLDHSGDHTDARQIAWAGDDTLIAEKLAEAAKLYVALHGHQHWTAGKSGTHAITFLAEAEGAG